MKNENYYTFRTVASNLTEGDYILHKWSTVDTDIKGDQWIFDFEAFLKVIVKTDYFIELRTSDNVPYYFLKNPFDEVDTSTVPDWYLEHMKERLKEIQSNANNQGKTFVGWLHEPVDRIVFIKHKERFIKA